MTDLSSLFHPIEPWHEEELLLIVSAKHCHGGDCCLFNLFLRHVMPCFSTFIFICHLFLGVIWGGLTWVGEEHTIVQKQLRRCYYLQKAYLV